jgi:hypothetical protein
LRRCSIERMLRREIAQSTSRSAADRAGLALRGLAIPLKLAMCVSTQERMKCLLSDIERLSVQIENVRNLGPGELDQTWCDLSPSERLCRVVAIYLSGTRVRAAG